MDVYESRKRVPVSIKRLPLRNSNAPPPPAATPRRPRDVTVNPPRYKSPTTPSPLSSSAAPRRFPSPTNVSSGRALPSERSRSAERCRVSTPVKDSSVVEVTSNCTTSLWPCTMRRSLSVSFQTDSISIPVTKKEKPICTSSNSFIHLSTHGSFSPSSRRNSSPERKLSKPVVRVVDSLHSKLIDQHRWPCRVPGERSTSSTSNTSFDLTDIKPMGPIVPIGMSILKEKPAMKAFDEVVQILSAAEKLGSASLPNRMVNLASTRAQSVPSPRLRQASPAKVLTSRGSESLSRNTRPSNPTRGVSPSRARGSSMCGPSSFSCSSSVLGFITDYKRGKKSARYIEEAHQLRLLHNRCLQWRFANAQADAVVYVQNMDTERTLYGVWTTAVSLRDSVVRKRKDLQRLKLEFKLNAMLNSQMAYLNDWKLVERDHVSSISGAVNDLEASTLRLPVAEGAKVDIESLKLAVCSAVDVMQAMGSSICGLLSQAEVMNRFVTDVANIAAQERSILEECEALLASTADMQIEEGSMRTQLIQMRQFLQTQAMLCGPDDEQLAF
ncbi:AUGMIN subunit 8 [Linum perenne]